MADREVLLQELYVKGPCGPWRVLVTTQMLNATNWPQAKIVLDKIFEKWPTPSCFIGISEEELEELTQVLKPLGLVSKRVPALVRMSQQFSYMISLFQDSWEKYNVRQLYGCSAYAEDAWILFVLKKPCLPKNKTLLWYAENHGLLKTITPPVEKGNV